METLTYIPALKYSWLTRFYDWLIATFLREKVWKGSLIESFAHKMPKAILDIGSGTGTLALMMSDSFPDSKIAGLDGDREILEIAADKITNRKVQNIQLKEGLSFNLPYPDNSFDVVTSSLMLHHLSNDDKHRTMKEVYRVLKPSGVFAVAATAALSAQGTSVGLVSTTTIFKEGVTDAVSLYALQPNEIAQVNQYSDGLGRVFQTVATGAAPGQ